jgi:hypothetical protein
MAGAGEASDSFPHKLPAGLSFAETGFIVLRQSVGMKQIHFVSKSEEKKPAAGVAWCSALEIFL